MKIFTRHVSSQENLYFAMFSLISIPSSIAWFLLLNASEGGMVIYYILGPALALSLPYLALGPLVIFLQQFTGEDPKKFFEHYGESLQVNCLIIPVVAIFLNLFNGLFTPITYLNGLNIPKNFNDDRLDLSKKSVHLSLPFDILTTVYANLAMYISYIYCAKKHAKIYDRQERAAEVSKQPDIEKIISRLQKIVNQHPEQEDKSLFFRRTAKVSAALQEQQAKKMAATLSLKYS